MRRRAMIMGKAKILPPLNALLIAHRNSSDSGKFVLLHYDLENNTVSFKQVGEPHVLSRVYKGYTPFQNGQSVEVMYVDYVGAARNARASFNRVTGEMTRFYDTIKIENGNIGSAYIDYYNPSEIKIVEDSYGSGRTLNKYTAEHVRDNISSGLGAVVYDTEGDYRYELHPPSGGYIRKYTKTGTSQLAVSPRLGANATKNIWPPYNDHVCGHTMVQTQNRLAIVSYSDFDGDNYRIGVWNKSNLARVNVPSALHNVQTYAATVMQAGDWVYFVQRFSKYLHKLNIETMQHVIVDMTSVSLAQYANITGWFEKGNLIFMSLSSHTTAEYTFKVYRADTKALVGKYDRSTSRYGAIIADLANTEQLPYFET